MAFTGLVVPFVGPVLGTVVALTVLWDLRDQTPNSASRTAVWATIVGTALVGIPALVLALVKADDWTALPVLTITICIAVVIAGAMHLAGWGSRAAAGGVVAALAGMGIAGALAVLAALAITWLFVLLVSEIFEAIVDAFTESF